MCSVKGFNSVASVPWRGVIVLDKVLFCRQKDIFHTQFNTFTFLRASTCMITLLHNNRSSLIWGQIHQQVQSMLNFIPHLSSQPPSSWHDDVMQAGTKKLQVFRPEVIQLFDSWMDGVFWWPASSEKNILCFVEMILKTHKKGWNTATVWLTYY